MRKTREALATFARKARLSKRSQKRYDTSPFLKRRGQRAYSLFVWISFAVIVVVPSILGAAYFGLVASSQYLTETRFTLQGGERPRSDELSSAIGLPSLSTVQDTQLVANYIQSRSIVEALENRINLRQLYGAPSIDWLSRFNASKPMERLVEYWKTKVDVSIEFPAGIVVVRVKAFSPEDSLRISKEVISLGESLVNELNRRMLADNIRSSEIELERASNRLVQAQGALESTRNQERLLDAGQSGKATGDLITGLRSEYLKIQRDYDSQLKHLSKTSPQVRATEYRLRAIADQIAKLEATLTGPTAGATSNLISGAMTRFSGLELEKRIAERQYAVASGALEIARASALRQQAYILVFVRPTLPEEARYPRRTLDIMLVLGGCVFAWGTICALTGVMRSHMA
jgi:capsular polysaccharide transport system permease protein